MKKLFRIFSKIPLKVLLRICLTILVASQVAFGIALISFNVHNDSEIGLILSILFTTFYIVLTIELTRKSD